MSTTTKSADLPVGSLDQEISRVLSLRLRGMPDKDIAVVEDVVRGVMESLGVDQQVYGILLDRKRMMARGGVRILSGPLAGSIGLTVEPYQVTDDPYKLPPKTRESQIAGMSNLEAAAMFGQGAIPKRNPPPPVEEERLGDMDNMDRDMDRDSFRSQQFPPHDPIQDPRESARTPNFFRAPNDPLRAPEGEVETQEEADKRKQGQGQTPEREQESEAGTGIGTGAEAEAEAEGQEEEAQGAQFASSPDPQALTPNPPNSPNPPNPSHVSPRYPRRTTRTQNPPGVEKEGA